MSIFVAAEVLRWKRYVAAAARQCFENLSCKFANNCESQLCLAWERPTPPLNPILFYTVEQINRGQQLGRKQRRPPQASCPPPLMCISSSSKMRDLLVEAKSSSRPPTGAAARSAEMEFDKKNLLLFAKYILNHNIVCTKLKWWIEGATARAPTALANTRCCDCGTADTLSFM